MAEKYPDGPRELFRGVRDLARIATRYLTIQPLAKTGQHTFPKNHREDEPTLELSLDEIQAQLRGDPPTDPNAWDVVTSQPERPVAYDERGFPVWEKPDLL